MSFSSKNGNANIIENQLSNSSDHNSVETDTAATELRFSSDSNKIQYSMASSESSCVSTNSNHSKEYFTIGNRFDQGGLSSLLNNNIIPDDDDHEMNSFTGNGTLGRLKSINKSLNQNSLPAKNFNTYVNPNNNNIHSNNSKNSSGANQTLNISATNNAAGGSSRFSNYGLTANGSIRSSIKQPRSSFAFTMRTNLDEEL